MGLGPVGLGPAGLEPVGASPPGGAAACAVMADAIASIRADMDEMTATNVCKVLPTLLAVLMVLLIVVLEPAEDAVVVVIVDAPQHTEVVVVVVVATVVVAMPWLVLPGISETFSTGEDIVTLHVIMLLMVALKSCWFDDMYSTLWAKAFVPTVFLNKQINLPNS